MPKDIKVKEKNNHYIRKLEKKIAFTSRVKRNVSNQYDKLKKEENNEKNIENSNATNYATTKIIRTGQNIKQNTTNIKNIAQKTSKAVVDIAKRVGWRNKNDNCIRRKFCFSNTYYYFTNSSNVWFCIWILIF